MIHLASPIIDDKEISAVTRVMRSGMLAQGAEVCAVVKADGYGHGAVAVAGAALDAGATWLAIATPAEALALVEGGIDPTTPMLLTQDRARVHGLRPRARPRRKLSSR